MNRLIERGATRGQAPRRWRRPDHNDAPSSPHDHRATTLASSPPQASGAFFTSYIDTLLPRGNGSLCGVESSCVHDAARTATQARFHLDVFAGELRYSGRLCGLRHGQADGVPRRSGGGHGLADDQEREVGRALRAVEGALRHDDRGRALPVTRSRACRLGGVAALPGPLYKGPRMRVRSKPRRATV